ncbi:MAG: hypothetical protein K940chlam9_01004 [Chlamydiae bacterium]|nr:hypothetical protein [Chlamydiota bacterium]
MPPPDEEEKRYKEAQSRVRKMKSFYQDLVTFVWVNILLLVINLIFSPKVLWFYWVALIWGIVLIARALNTFTIKDRFLGKEWEEKKIDEILKKEKHKKP